MYKFYITPFEVHLVGTNSFTCVHSADMGAQSSTLRSLDHYQQLQRESVEFINGLREQMSGANHAARQAADLQKEQHNSPSQNAPTTAQELEATNAPEQSAIPPMQEHGDTAHEGARANMIDQARQRLSSVSSELQDLTRRASSAFSQGNREEANHLLSQAEDRNRESHGILSYLHNERRPSSFAVRTTRMAVHTVVPPPCRWGIYCLGKCCCCCCYPPELDQVL